MHRTLRTARQLLRLMVVVGFVTLVVFTSGGAEAATVGRPLTNKEILQKMFQQVQDKKTLSYDGSLQILTNSTLKNVPRSYNGLGLSSTDSSSMGLSFSGFIDQRDDQNPKSFIQLSLDSSKIDPVKALGTVQLIGIDKTAYLNVVSDQLFSLLNDLGLGDLHNLSGTWIKVDNDSVNKWLPQYAQLSAGSAIAGEAQATLSPVKQAALFKLAQQGTLFSSARLRDSSINGEPAYHFKLTVNRGGLRSFMIQARKVVDGKTPTGKDLKDLNALLKDLPMVQGELWLGKVDYLPKKFVLNSTVAKNYTYEKVLTKTSLVLEFGGFDGIPTISAPSSYQTLDQVASEVQKAEAASELKARDDRRVNDLKDLQAALNLFYTDKGQYPNGTNAVLGTDAYSCLDASGWQTDSQCSEQSKVYMWYVPQDPSGRSYTYSVVTDASGKATSYVITAQLEGTTADGLSGAIKVTPSGMAKQ